MSTREGSDGNGSNETVSRADTSSAGRERQDFSSRIGHRPAQPRRVGTMAATLLPDVLHRHVVGVDDRTGEMSADEAALLRDPFGRLLRSGGPFPLSLRRTLERLDALSGDEALPDQLVFLVADGGHVPWSEDTADLRRAFRFAIARGRGAFPVLISASTMIDSEEDKAFLQIIGWDEEGQVFHFYQRLGGTFIWAGMSTHALAAPSRGKGPFDSHVNGSMVMKELRSPWIHWHAPLAGINAEAFAPDDPIRDDDLFHARVTAERLETEVVRPGIRRWNRARIARLAVDHADWRPIECLRQVVGDTTVNLATSETASLALGPGGRFRPPLSFFLNRDVLFDALDLAPDDPAEADISIGAEDWLACLERYDVHRSDGAIRIPGEGTFVFLTPEAAFEDTDLFAALLDAGLLSRRFATSLAMTDYANPVFSDPRSSLLSHVPDRVTGPDLRSSLETAFVASLRAVPDGSGFAEREFLRWWDDPTPEAAARSELSAYFAALRSAMTDPNRIDDWFQIAEFRRRRFRKRPLDEFELTTPRTSIPDDAPEMVMGADGRGRLSV